MRRALLIIAAILVVLWLIGLSLKVLSVGIHILLIAAIILIIVSFVVDR